MILREVDCVIIRSCQCPLIISRNGKNWVINSCQIMNWNKTIKTIMTICISFMLPVGLLYFLNMTTIFEDAKLVPYL